MKFYPSFQKFNAAHEAVTIFPDLAGDGINHVKANLADMGAEILVCDPRLLVAELLKVDVIDFNDARFQIRKAVRNGNLVLAIDCGKVDDFVYFGLLDEAKAVQNGKAFVVLNAQRAEEFFGTKDVTEWVKQLRYEAEKMEKALNNRVFFISGPDPKEQDREEDGFFYGPYFGLKDAEKAASDLYPDFCYSDKDFEVVYRLKQPA